MSTPEDRLIGSYEAERLQRDAVAVLTEHQHSDSAMRYLALESLALVRDGGAQHKLSAIRPREKVV